MDYSLINYNQPYKIYYDECVGTNSAVMKAIKKNRLWEKKLIPYFEKYITKDSNVIDCGAYIGSHTIIMSNLAKFVYSFEPQIVVGNCLKKTIKENNIKNIKFINKGLSNIPEIKTIQTNHDGDANFFINKKRKRNYEQTYQVDMTTLDNEIKCNIDLIKIDCEGYEFLILEGAKEIIKNNKPIILIEVFKHKINFLYEWCKFNEYSYRHLGGDDYILIPS